MKQKYWTGLSILSSILLSIPWLGTFSTGTLLFAFFPLLFVENSIYVQKQRYKSIVFFGYAILCFFLWNLISTWWITRITIIEGGLVIILNAIFMAIIWWLFHIIHRHFSSSLSYLSLISMWISFEYLHFRWSMAWPWLTLGNGFANSPKIIQWYEYTGVMGGSLWIIIVNILFLSIYLSYTQKGIKNSMGKIICIFIVILLPSIISVRTYNHYREEGKSWKIGIIQPNIDPYTEKFKAMSQKRQSQRLISMTDSIISDSADFILWPETSISSIWENNKIINDSVIHNLYYKTVLYPFLNIIIGATTKKKILTDIKKKKNYIVYNSAILINKEEKIQIYHKNILVTGAEKMPFEKYSKWMNKFLVNLGGTTESLGTTPVKENFTSSSGIKVASAICFESVFGEYMAQRIKQDAELIFFLTNDGWCKGTTGYLQHLSYARLRAIETRRSIAQAANTGVSALINQRGDIIKQTKWWEKAVMQGELKSNDKITFYVKYGDSIGRVCSFMAIMLIILCFSTIYTRKNKTKKVRINSIVQNP